MSKNLQLIIAKRKSLIIGLSMIVISISLIVIVSLVVANVFI